MTIWEIFDEITRVPRPSKHEEKIVAWLVDFARRHGLEHRQDAIGNVVIVRPASAGREGAPTVVLQNHVDMVCEKDSTAVNAAGRPFDFSRDAIRTYVEDGWMRARGTTLGADNGLGMAAALALLIDPTVETPRLEALFTVDEETGLTGAFNLGADMITGKLLINLDSEDEGEVFIGCAGGVDTLATFDFEWEPAPAGYEFFEVSVSGLKGGHSGDDIDKGRGNANKILARLLQTASERLTRTDDGPKSKGPVAVDAKGEEGVSAGASVRLANIDGGNLRNAIPREARAVVGVPGGAEFLNFVKKFAADARAELAFSDPGVMVGVKPSAADRVIGRDTAQRLLRALVGVPNGVQAMSFAMPGLVEASTNLASVKMGGDAARRAIVATTSQRSSVESAKRAAAQSVGAVFALAGARVEHSDGYPGWAPNPSSPLLAKTVEAYKKLFGHEPKVRAIHAGLECGLFLEKFPELDMVSFGPTILGAHSPDERIEIASVDKFWRHLKEVLWTL